MDLIDRQAAIDEIAFSKEMLNRVLDDMDVVGVDREKYAWGLGLIESLIDDIRELPSAQPERKRGEWIRKSPTAWMWTCSCCKKDDAYAYSSDESFEPVVLQDLFCPNCGAYMKEENDA